jgi:hypothetical protein
MKNILPALVTTMTLLILFSCKNADPTTQTGNDTVLIKKTLAEIWYKTGGHFENGKYIGGSEFKKFDFLRVPDECTDHSFFIKYEGPGWESDKIGYRIYLDWRNAVDIFGKKADTIILPYVGQDGYESYHAMADWGQDILKVGESLGIGTLGYWDGKSAKRVSETDSVICKIKDGDTIAKVMIDYYGWNINKTKLDLETSLSIESGSRVTKYEIDITGNIDNLCTGIVKMEETTLLNSQHEKGWNYLATWGKQSLAGDSLGLAILYEACKEITSDEFSHVVVLKPSGNKLVYYFLGAWEKEPGGITTKTEFKFYLDSLVNNLQ